MKTLLRIDTSIRVNDSNTRLLADYFQTRWQSAHPEGTVIHRCLVTDPVPHLCNETIEAFFQTGGSSPASQLSDTLIDELQRADHLLIGSPLYNLTLPSTLKAYFDHVVRSGVTFAAQQGHYRGLLTGKSATVITARGGKSSFDQSGDFQTAYLKAILAFMGIGPVEVVALEGMALGPELKEQALSSAKQHVDRLFDRSASPVWRGEFSEEDKQQILALRRGQADAILQGDAQAYAALCTDDIQLLIPCHDLVSGRAAFLETEQALLDKAPFASFQKFPVRIERSGEVVVEMGRQSVGMHQHNGSGGVFSARQTYTHVLRLTEQGWRFALLMSNPIE